MLVATYTILVVRIGNLVDAQVFSFVQILLLTNNATVEELLQLFVAVVDAKLLERVLLKVL